MAREKTPPKDTSGEIPAWFMTYSDVITLLMTFFILLLTFASQEPEKFEQMQVSMFGGGGSDGFAGPKADAMEREAVALRYRPEKSRMTSYGSETPPLKTDASSDGLNDGLKALDESTDLASFQRVTFAANRNSILESDGTLTPSGRKQISEMARQLIKFPMKLSISVPSAEDLPAAVLIAHDMSYEHGVALGTVSVSRQPNPVGNAIEFTITRDR